MKTAEQQPDLSFENSVEETEQFKSEDKQSPLQIFLEQVNSFPNVDDKIHYALEFMRASLTQEGSPRFRDFWEVRRLCLPLFREGLSFAARAHLWSDYVALSNEAKRLKEILDEQSAFAVEQIELALQSIEQDMLTEEELLSRTEDLELPDECVILASKREIYSAVQKQLDLLNAYASRIHGLRKEVIKTEMRVRFKSRFLQRLSRLGDNVFPRRRDSIKQISDAFKDDVLAFKEERFRAGLESGEISAYDLQEEVKGLQRAAKLFTLNTATFTETRVELASCWDELKDRIRELKKESFERKAFLKENSVQILERVNALKEEIKEEKVTFDQVLKESEEILREMRGVALGRDEVRFLKEEIQSLQEPFFAKLEAERAVRMKEAEEGERLKREKVQKLKQLLAELLQTADTLDVENLSQQKEEISKEIELIGLSKMERQLVERQLKQLRDYIADKREKDLIPLSEDDLEAFVKLKTVLQQKKERRTEIQSQIKIYRKFLAQSGLDFEKAMHYREQMDSELERLEKIASAISEIEGKIKEFDR